MIYIFNDILISKVTTITLYVTNFNILNSNFFLFSFLFLVKSHLCPTFGYIITNVDCHIGVHMVG
jgi:hypothetical protein